LAEELGITGTNLANPVEAAAGSAGAFTLGAAIPLIAIAIGTASTRIALTLGVVTLSLIGLGFVSARYGKASTGKPIFRVVLGGLVAMGITMAVGKFFGAAVA
jgi:VIT1/CCC1 family predicted Fe2+/Mn2+ transporter